MDEQQDPPPSDTQSDYIPPLLVGDDVEQIYGGTETDGYPDCCALGNEFMGYFCTGTLVAPNVVLTAKHCALDYNMNRVFLNGSDVTEPEGAEIIDVKEAHPHPDANVDLLVLVLEKPSTVKPRAIAKNVLVKPENAIVVGFGRTNPSGTKGFGTKRKATVPVMTLDCNDAESGTKYGCRPGIELVAGHRGLKRDTCKGDSGGPLYIEDDEGNVLLLGVTSRGVQGAGKRCGNGGIYVRADRFADWIRSETGANI
jgi:secreted trypsin-like serine protease